MVLPIEPKSPRQAVPPCASYSPRASPIGTSKRSIRRTTPTPVSTTSRAVSTTSRAIFVALVLFVALVPVSLHRNFYDQVTQEQLAPYLKGWLGDAKLDGDEENISSMLEEDLVANLSENNQAGQPAKYAYAYLIGGCKPEAPSYRYYFYNILINTHLQRQEGSTADVVVFVQMKFDSAHDRITEEDQHLFNAMNITVEYIPKAKDESFYRLMHDKFLILRMTRYKRIMFLDGDGMLFSSLLFISSSASSLYTHLQYPFFQQQ